MKIATKNDHLVVLLEGAERFYALRATICVQKAAIVSVVWEADYPKQSELGGFRAPGTAIPFVFQAGSYWHKRRWEFRYLRLREQGQLVITTTLSKYAKIRVSTDEATALTVVEWFNVRDMRKLSTSSDNTRVPNPRFSSVDVATATSHSDKTSVASLELQPERRTDVRISRIAKQQRKVA